MTYFQTLINSKGRYKLVWLPSQYCEKGNVVEILFKNWEMWTIKEVYSEVKDEVYDGKKLIFVGKTHSLSGDKLQERLKLDRNMITSKRIRFGE